MPVWVSTDPKDDLTQAGKQRRHISPDCPTYLANVTTANRPAAKGRPNTEKLQERTVRCDDPSCWIKREAEDATKPKRKSGGTSTGKTSAMKAANVPTTTVGGKAQNLADRAKAARDRKQPAAAAA
jgi:hypothetical protein